MTDVVLPDMRLHIRGAPQDAMSGATFATFDPATGTPISEVACAGAEDVNAAVDAARRAQPAWAARSAAERAGVLDRLAGLLEARADELGRLESLDAGKPLVEAIAQVRGAAAEIRTKVGLSHDLRGIVAPTDGESLAYTLREPLGVIGVVTPWNYPLILYALSVPAALAVGNTVVLKPAEQTPLTALAFAALGAEAGLPPGALNVVPGVGEEAGAALVEHPDVDMIVFTGSTAVGRQIGAVAGQQLKRLLLELGGKSPNVVFADADMDRAAAAALFGFTINQGQLCSAGTRLLVQSAIHDEFVDRLVTAAEALTVGDPLAPGTQLGSLISAKQLARVEGYVKRGLQDGATLVCGGAQPDVGERCRGGYFYRPTIFTDVTSDMAVAQEEIFGPVLCVLPFADEDEAIQLANDTSYGLTASVWTEDLTRAHRMAAGIACGAVSVNTFNGASSAPFDFYKASGVGVAGGRELVESMTRRKSVVVELSGRSPAHPRQTTDALE